MDENRRRTMKAAPSFSSPRRTSDSASSAVEEFFLRALPSLITARLESFAAMSGTIVFAVNDGSAFTVRLGDLDEPVVASADAAGDLRLTFTADGLVGFLAGDRSAATAGMEAEGDVELLADFGRLLVGPRSALALRLDR